MGAPLPHNRWRRARAEPAGGVPAMTKHEDVPDDRSGTAVSGDGAVSGDVVSGDVLGGVAGEAGPVSGAAPGGDGVADVVARLTSDDLAPKERRRLIGQLAGALRQRGFRDMFRPKAAMGWLS